MDSLRGFDDDAAFAAAEEEPAMDHPPEIGVDERRMHVRAYNYWVSLLAGRPYPSIEDVDPASIEDFGANSVLLDFSRDQSDPEIAFLGRALREECGFDSSIRRISEVPARSLLSRLTDHYLQIIANRAPIGFEAEFMGRRGNATLYRGILMPLSSDGTGIDFIYGVINWKELADAETAGILSDEVARAAAPVAECSVWADGPNADLPTSGSPADEEDHPALGLWDEDAPLAPDASLADRLCLARRIAEAACEADQRGRAALYRAIGHAWDFALAAEAAPEDFAEILADAGMKAQARAPMTPVVKLVFGAGYDKTRLTEFAAALCWARREGVRFGELADRIAGFVGGLKGIVQAERRARRPRSAAAPAEAAREKLRAAPVLGRVTIDLDGRDDEFVLLVGRREQDGGVAIVAPVADPGLTERALRSAA